jgi:osmotically-inducible protein OsmY
MHETNESTVAIVAPEVVADEVIAQEIRDYIRSYDPLKASRDKLNVAVMNGVVRLSGYVETKRVRRFLMDYIPDLPGVLAIDDTLLYDDESLMLEVGKILPWGVRIRVDHGMVSLIGTLPNTVTAQDLILDISEIPGVDEVINLLK